MEIIFKETSANRGEISSDLIDYVIFFFSLIGLYFTSLYSYLLFHSLAELLSIVVAFSLFIITWNSKRYIENQYLLFIGITYLFIGFIDLLHTLSYSGMPIFKGEIYYANQLWISARYLDSLSLLVAFSYFYTRKKVSPYALMGVLTFITTLLVLSIFVWKNFPACFIKDVGQTPFKKNSEYIICAILTLDIFLLYKNQDRFEKPIFFLLLWSLICTIISELAFTFYISNYGLSNLIGHYFKIFAYVLVYQAIIKTCLDKPYRLIFRELARANKLLKEEVEARKKTENDLVTALSEVKKLSGLLPICANCKKIRDDRGYWNQIEIYIREHSEADFSHGICPDCMEKLYPDLARNILERYDEDHEERVSLDITGRGNVKRAVEKEWSRCAREGRSLSLILVRFPELRRCGGQFMRELEKKLKGSLKRPSDSLAGYGDDSYAIILPSTDEKGIRQVADTILHDYVMFRAERSDECMSGAYIHLAMVTTVPQHEKDARLIIAAAEENLRGLEGKHIDQVSQAML